MSDNNSEYFPEAFRRPRRVCPRRRGASRSDTAATGQCMKLTRVCFLLSGALFRLDLRRSDAVHLVRYAGDLREGVRHGKGILKLRNGGEYDGQWASGRMHGFGVYIWPDAQIYKGEWVAGLRHGEGTVSLPSGERSGCSRASLCTCRRRRPMSEAQLGASCAESRSFDAMTKGSGVQDSAFSHDRFGVAPEGPDSRRYLMVRNAANGVTEAGTVGPRAPQLSPLMNHQTAMFACSLRSALVQTEPVDRRSTVIHPPGHTTYQQVQRAMEGREEARGGRVAVEQRANKVRLFCLHDRRATPRGRRSRNGDAFLRLMFESLFLAW